MEGIDRGRGSCRRADVFAHRGGNARGQREPLVLNLAVEGRSMGVVAGEISDLEARVASERERTLTLRLRLLITVTMGIVVMFMIASPAVRSGTYSSR
jgi:hypothetical protein